ncbi:MAG: hypothetical protein RLZZ38_1063 [Bacteroidota bacterium]|jgi:hypothetical protein
MPFERNFYLSVMEQIEQQITALKAQLTGDLFSDIETQQKIYELKKQLNPEIEVHPEQDDDDGCLYCGS